jgi:hypothetical protein
MKGRRKRHRRPIITPAPFKYTAVTASEHNDRECVGWSLTTMNVAQPFLCVQATFWPKSGIQPPVRCQWHQGPLRIQARRVGPFVLCLVPQQSRLVSQ